MLLCVPLCHVASISQRARIFVTFATSFIYPLDPPMKYVCTKTPEGYDFFLERKMSLSFLAELMELNVQELEARSEGAETLSMDGFEFRIIRNE